MRASLGAFFYGKMRRLKHGFEKRCRECDKVFIPKTCFGRPLGRSSLNWKKRQFCSRSCSASFTGRGQKRCLGKHWKIKDVSKMCGRHLTEEQKNRIGQFHKGKKMPKLVIDRMTGKNNRNWKGGITSKDRMERVRFQKTMQKQIFERDNYKCTLCGEGGNLQVDHIQRWSEYIEGRFDMNNCRTLCAKCHYKITFGREMPQSVKGWGHNLIERVVV